MAEKKSGGRVRQWFENMRDENMAVPTPELDAAVGNAGAKKTTGVGDIVSALWAGAKEAGPSGSIANISAQQLHEQEREFQYDRLDRLDDKKHKDTFVGQFGANRTLGRLSQDANIAWSEYARNPTKDNRDYAEAVSKAAEKFQLTNAEALDDINAKATLLTKDLASYLPQFKDQTAAQIGGGALGLVVGGGPTGAKVGAAAASGMYSANVMRGAAFKTLLDLGIDEDTARKAANDEAFISGLLESGDTLIDLATLGTGKLITTLGKGTVKTAAKAGATGLVGKMLKGLGKYGLNITEEGLQEGLQQAISIANAGRVEGGDADAGKLDLAKRALSLYWDRLRGEASAEDTAEIKAAEAGGARLAALLGGATMAGSAIANRGVQQRQEQTSPLLVEAEQKASAPQPGQSSPLIIENNEPVFSEGVEVGEEVAPKRDYAKEANGILRDPERLSDFEREHGTLSGSNEQKVSAIARVLYEQSRAAQNEHDRDIAEYSAMMGALDEDSDVEFDDITAEQLREENLGPGEKLTPEQSYVRGLLLGRLTNKDISEILNNPQYAQIFEQMTGERLRGSDKKKGYIIRAGAKKVGDLNAVLSRLSDVNKEWNSPLIIEQEAEQAQTPERNPMTDALLGEDAQTGNTVSQQQTEQQTEQQTGNTASQQQTESGPQTEQQTGPSSPPPGQSTNPTGADGKTNPNFAQSTEGQPGGTERTSQTPHTVRNSRVTTEEMRDVIDRKGAEGDYNYWPITNDETVQRASETIAREGWDNAYASWVKAVHDGKAGDQITAIGAILYNHALSAGNKELASDILATYTEALRNTARGLQAGKIIQSLSPDSRLYMIQRSISRYAADLGIPDDIVLSEELKKAYREAKTEQERNDVINQMQDEVAKQLPTTLMEKWNSLRFTNMLGNFKTQIRNFGGNATSRVLSGFRNAFRTFIESAVYAKDPSKRTSSYYVGKEFKDVGRRDFRDTMSGAVMEGTKFADNSPQGFMRGVQDKKQIFKFAPMEAYRKVTQKAMENGDRVFSEEAYARAIAGWMKAKGISAEQFSAMLDAEKAGNLSKADAKLLDDGRLFAVQEAQEITFRDDNAFSNWISKVGRRKDTPKAVKVLSEGLLPFRKTPANVLVRAIEYSPLGLIETAYKAVQMKKPGSEITGTDIINSLSKTLTGTGLFIVGAALKNSGWLTGGEDDEKQGDFDDLRGAQEWSLFLPDGTNFTMDWASSVAFPLFMGAEFAKAVGDDGVQWADLDDAMLSIADPLLEFSMMQGINDTLNNVKYSDNSLMQLAAQTAVGYLTQGLTNSLLGQFERSWEGGNKGRKETFVDKDSGVPAWVQRSLGKASAKTPGWDYQQVDYVDAWGRTQDYENPLLNGLEQFASPDYVSSDRSTAADSELQRLYDLGYTSVFPQRFAQSDEITTRDAEGNSIGKRHLTAEEYEQFNRTMGSTRLELAESLIGSAQYKNMSNDEKAKAIENIYSVGKAKAMLEVDPSYKPDSWVREALEAKDPAKYIGLYSAAQKLQPWGDNESVSSWQKVKYVAKAAGNDADEYIPLFFDTDSNYPKKYELARERGYSAERFAEFYEAYATIESDRDANGKSLGNVRQKVVAALVSQGWPEKYANEMYNLFKADRTKLNDWSW